MEIVTKRTMKADILRENLHQIEANEEKRPSKFEEDIVLTDRDCGKRNQLGKI